MAEEVIKECEFYLPLSEKCNEILDSNGNEIYIDGVDVSECCFYNGGKCDNPNGMACNCINNAVCYFKELRRLEQENKKLKEIKDETYFRLKEEYLFELKRLEQLKNKYYQQTLDDEIQINNLLEEIQQIKQDRNVENITMLSLENSRLEQENKELKEKIIELSEEKGHLIVENNTLKESNQSLSMLGTDLVSANETVRKEFFRADKNKDMWREKAEEYRSALEEIREIVRADCKGCTAECDCNDDCTRFKIKNKINEVLNESN
jgi:hypothetical protein